MTGIELYHILRPFAQPVIGTVHGWFATKMVIIMLFRPYKTYYFPYTNKAIPFTPGIFPRRKKALGINIANTVTGTLLTPKDIQAQTQKLVTEENIYAIINVLIDTMIEGFQYTNKIQKLANQISNSLPKLVNKAVSKIIDNLIEDKNNQLTYLVDNIIHKFLINFRINSEQAKKIVDKIFETILTPEQIRLILCDVLTPETTGRIEKAIKEHSSGILKLVLFFSNIQKFLLELKQQLEKRPEESCIAIEKIITELGLKAQISLKLSTLNLQTLSFEKVFNLKITIKNSLQTYLKDKKESILQLFESMQSSILETLNSMISTFNPAQIDPQLIITVKQEITKFLYEYLQKELESLIKDGLGRLGLADIIINKIENYSSQDIENLILGIMKRELKNLELLGAFIGLLLGLIAFCIEYFLPVR